MSFTLVFRRLRQQPGFTAAVVITLALGLGATMAILVVADAVLLRPLPYADADRLVMIEGEFRRLGLDNLGVAAAELEDYRSAHSFDGVAAFRIGTVSLSGAGEPEQVRAGQVSAALFPLLAATPQLGRALRATEEAPGSDGVVVLGDGLWRRRFAADPLVIGRAVRIDGRSRVIVGVMPPGFTFPHPSFRFARAADLWIPLALTAAERADRASYTLRALARLRSGASIAEARAELAAIGRRMEREHPGEYRGPGGEDGGWNVALVPYRDEVVGDAAGRLAVLLAAVGLLLAIACANVAGLFFARSLGRRRELALRLALGARRRDLVREALTESLTLALLGGALGLLLAWGASRLLVVLAPESLPRLGELAVDRRTVGFASLLSLVTGAAFGLLAPLSAAGGTVRQSLAAVSESATHGGLLGNRAAWRRLLVGVQLALALVLLADAGLVLRSLYFLLTVDAGFGVEGGLAVELVLPVARYPEPYQQAGFFGRLLSRVEGLPGVERAGIVSQLPLSGPGLNGPFSVEGRPLDLSGPPTTASYRAASAGYFEAMRMELRGGRFLAASDAPPGAATAVVNEALVRRSFAGEVALGRRLKLGAPGSPRPWLTIVGVMRDVSEGRPGAEAQPEIYVPYAQDPAAAMTLVVRAAGDPRALAPMLRAAVRAEDPEQAVASVRALDEVRAESVQPERLAACLLGGFALLALALTMVGVYGVATQVARQRTRELGIRVAVGADRRDLVRLLVGQSLALALIAVGVGLLGAIASARLLGSHLAGIGPIDIPTLAAAAALLTALTVLAAWLPVRRACRVEPFSALRLD